MNTFEQAKAKYEKNREKQERPLPKVEVPEKKEVKEVKRDGPMVVSITGPQEIVLEIEYAGTLLAGQLTKEELTGLLKRQLSVLGRVRCL